MMEMFVMTIYDDVIKAAIGEKAASSRSLYTCSQCSSSSLRPALLGLLPIFPGGANVTGNINVTFFLAMCTMIAINLFGNKEYWKDIFWPHVPVFLKAPVPLMPVIEFFGVFTKPFALMVRLFANMMAGHAIILSFTCVIFLGWSLGVGYGIGLNTVNIIMMLFMNMLEVLVAFVPSLCLHAAECGLHRTGSERRGGRKLKARIKY